MYYELYIDVFFLVNFMMDIFILIIAKNILRCPATNGSICIGAVTGSILTCIFVLLPIAADWIKFMVVHGVIIILMIRIGLRIRFNKRFFKVYIVVYISAFLVGGIFSCLKQYIRGGSIFFLFAFLSYAIAKSIWKFIICFNRTEEIQCEVLLVNGTNQIRVNAIIDTGNRLKDDVTGEPVSIISRKTANVLWSKVPEEGVRYIPYCTIEGKGGVLLLLTLEKMCLYMEEKVWIHKVLVAVCEEKIGTGEYEMILNPYVR